MKNLKKNPFEEGDFRQGLSQFGDSFLVISDDEMAKVHIHTEEPGDALNYAQHTVHSST